MKGKKNDKLEKQVLRWAHRVKKSGYHWMFPDLVQECAGYFTENFGTRQQIMIQKSSEENHS